MSLQTVQATQTTTPSKEFDLGWKVVRWTGWFGLAGVILFAIELPLWNVVDHNGFYNPAGWGATIVANVPPLIWFLVTSLAMIHKR